MVRCYIALIVGLVGSPLCAEAPAEVLLPEGFTASVFHDGVGARARHLAARANGDLFVSRRDGTLVALRDSDGDGVADITAERKLPITTGLQLHAGYLYFSDDVSVSRIALSEALMPQSSVETVVDGFPAQGSHAAKAFTINAAGKLFVNVGAPSNACQRKHRSPGSPGMEPCPQLEHHAAIWSFSADKLAQQHSDGNRYVTGTRNVVALDWNTSAQALYFVMHGRDQLSTLWPAQFDDTDSAAMPAEEFHVAVEGANYGWPYTFVDPHSKRRLRGPEYGGDGSQEAQGGTYQAPLHAYPAHWAPNDLLFYHGNQFPARFRGGAFIAWRGSWNRAPLPQDGYRVTFQPFTHGRPTAEPIDFMMGFKGSEPLQRPADARWRPGGLAEGPAGSLYVTEAVEGRVWKVTYSKAR